MAPKRFSTASSIMSRTSEPEMPETPAKQIGRNAIAACGGGCRLPCWKLCSIVQCLRRTTPVSNSTCRYAFDIRPSSSLSACTDCPVEMGGSSGVKRCRLKSHINGRAEDHQQGLEWCIDCNGHHCCGQPVPSEVLASLRQRLVGDVSGKASRKRPGGRGGARRRCDCERSG